MGKTLASTCKMCRREGVTLCGRENCAVKKRPTLPGVHGPKYLKRKPRMSSYGIQLREKQKAKRLYNIMERQFRRYFDEAMAMPGNTGELLISLLERRLDNVVYRLGLAATRRQARQIVSHALIEVNGKTVNIPSFRVRVGDEVRVRDNKKEKGLFKDITERIQKQDAPKWLTVDATTLSGKVTSLPQEEDVEKIFDPKLIVEFYSR